MLHIRLLDPNEEIPYHLLLLADETVEAIHKYVFDSSVYIAQIHTTIIGVFCLYRNSETEIEIKNIAIKETFQNLGYGSILIDFIKKEAQKNFKTLIVGTADVGYKQIRFYERNGFKVFDRRKNFFIENYPYPIIENGKELKDMILLKYDL